MISKQTAIILILVVFLGSLGALIWFYFSFNTTPPPITPSVQPLVDVYDPFGTKITPPATTTETPANITPVETPISINKLRLISENPVSGYSIINNIQTKKTDIHYIYRANGNIYETYADSPETKRLSITTIPKVYESMWLPSGQNLIIRYLKDDNQTTETFSVKIIVATSTLNEFEGGVDGNHLPEGISALAINPLGNKIFYLTNNLNGASGFTAKPDDSSKKLIFESPLIEWLVSWPKEEIITLNTKPSAGIPGYMYFLNSQTGGLTRVIGGINGLTTKTNKTASEVLYSDSIRGTPRLYLYNIKSGESKLLPWNTLPEKCVWGNMQPNNIYCAVPKTFSTGSYPDDWYQGLTSFNDDIWMIDMETMAETQVYDIQKETNNNIDVTELQIDKDDNFLYFINKTDLTFWSLNLK